MSGGKQAISPVKWTPEASSSSLVSEITPKYAAIASQEEDDSNREDGELSDDSADMDDIDYNILPRPKELLEEVKSSAFANVVENVPSGSELSGFQNGGAVGTENELRADAGPVDIDIEYSDGEDVLGESSSDSDSDEPSFKRNSMNYSPVGFRTSFNNPNSLQAKSPWNLPMPGISPQPTSICDEKMLKFQEKRKMNNIWTKVLEEEQQQQTLTKLEDIDVDGNRVLVERGSESYSFKPGTVSSTLKRKRNVPGSVKKNRNRPDDSDISSTGLSDDDLEYIRESKTSMKDRDTEGIAGEGKFKLLPIRRIQQIVHKKRGRDLSYYIAKELGEPKAQLIVRACELLGKHYCIHMFIKTLKIERKSGLPIKSQARRRTPGGIFFYMIRKDNKFPPETVNAVFQLDREITLKEKKAARNLQRHERKAELERRQHRLMKMKGTKPINVDNNKGKDEAMDEEGELAYSGDSLDSGSESEVSLNSSPENFDTPVVDDSNEAEISDELTNDYLDIQVASNEFD